ncbi:MAG: DNA ligase [Bacteroidota bacterium]
MTLRWLRALLLSVGLLLPAARVVAETPAILLANIYRDQVDVARYLVSEKLDGVRAIWDGQTLRFRSGREVPAPRWFLDGLPKQSLDGELWAGRGTFERLSGIVRREVPDDAEWRGVRYMIFELPGAPGSFRERAERIQQMARQANVPWLAAIEQSPVADRDSLKKRFTEVVAAGGEGLMLHLADAPYETGRSDVLLKMKPWLDTEATVIGHLPGKGKYVGMLGALRLRMPDGRLFSLGTGFSDEQRRHPPPIGAIVTYRYRDLTNKGMPKFASFLRIREE